MTLSAKAANVVACWPLDEGSGDRADSVGSLDLTDVNTVASGGAFKFNSAADFTAANSERLVRGGNDNALDCANQLYMGRVWVRLKTNTAEQCIMQMWNQNYGDNGRAWFLYFDPVTGSGTQRFKIRINAASEGTVIVAADNLGEPAVDTWYLIHWWHDPTANTVNIAVDGGTADSAAANGGLQGAVNARFALGVLIIEDAAIFSNYANAYIDEPLIMVGAILDATERTEDVNGGAGKAFENWGGAPSVLWTRPLLHSQAVRRASSY